MTFSTTLNGPIGVRRGGGEETFFEHPCQKDFLPRYENHSPDERTLCRRPFLLVRLRTIKVRERKTFFLLPLQDDTGGSMNGRANSCSIVLTAHHFDVVDVREAPDEDVDVDQRR